MTTLQSVKLDRKSLRTKITKLKSSMTNKHIDTLDEFNSEFQRDKAKRLFTDYLHNISNYKNAIGANLTEKELDELDAANEDYCDTLQIICQKLSTRCEI